MYSTLSIDDLDLSKNEIDDGDYAVDRVSLAMDIDEICDMYEQQNVRVIRYVVSTEIVINGKQWYNPTYRWGEVQDFFSWIERYVLVKYLRVNSGATLHLRQGRKNVPSGWAAYTDQGADIMRINHAFRFGSQFQQAIVLNHETGHCNLANPVHIDHPDALMNPNGGPGKNWTEQDYRHLTAGGVYKWRSNLRPHHEPNAMRERFNAPAPAGYVETAFTCGCC